MVPMTGVLCSSGTLSQGLLPTCLDYCSEFTTVVIPCVYICGVCMCMHVWVYVCCGGGGVVYTCWVYAVCMWGVFVCGMCICVGCVCVCMCGVYAYIYDKI